MSLYYTKLFFFTNIMQQDNKSSTKGNLVLRFGFGFAFDFLRGGVGFAFGFLRAGDSGGFRFGLLPSAVFLPSTVAASFVTFLPSTVAASFETFVFSEFSATLESVFSESTASFETFLVFSEFSASLESVFS